MTVDHQLDVRADRVAHGGDPLDAARERRPRLGAVALDQWTPSNGASLTAVKPSATAVAAARANPAGARSMTARLMLA